MVWLAALAERGREHARTGSVCRCGLPRHRPPTRPALRYRIDILCTSWTWTDMTYLYRYITIDPMGAGGRRWFPEPFTPGLLLTLLSEFLALCLDYRTDKSPIPSRNHTHEPMLSTAPPSQRSPCANGLLPPSRADPNRRCLCSCSLPYKSGYTHPTYPYLPFCT
ncbi:hypothetical protein LZ30DRAFT_75064 [Colletotrichum cereale]|nr:hypothetical protein LZ30DRAFT_75064 [Colletotrichum cereale]